MISLSCLASAPGPRLGKGLLTAALLLFSAVGLPAAAHAGAPAPAWTITATPLPTNFTPGDTSGLATYRVSAVNGGAAATDGSPITITDTLPPGLSFHSSGLVGTGSGDSVSCSGTQTITCIDPGPGLVGPGSAIQIDISVDVAGDAPSSVTDTATVTGGGGASASTSQPTAVDASPAAFGLGNVEVSLTGPDGSPAVQAGSHPFAQTVSFAVNTKTDAAGKLTPAGNVKDIEVRLPPGLVGDPSATPTCPAGAFFTTSDLDCPPNSQIGIADLRIQGTAAITADDWEPVWNLPPPADSPFNLGIHPTGILGNVPDVMSAAVRTGGDYGITIDNREVIEKDSLFSARLSTWGVPADSSHDSMRRFCFAEGQSSGTASGSCPANVAPRPLLTLPTSCAAPMSTTIRVDSWENPGDWKTYTVALPPPTGCDKLDFSPQIKVQPDVGSADSASGVHVDLHVPQNDNPTGLGEANLKKAVVTLPPGVTLNPAAADGLAGCAPAEIAIDDDSEPSCPDASKVATVEVDTPVLPDPLEGAVYLATPFDNPFSALVAGYIVAEGHGVLVKLAGKFDLDPQTGQITGAFDNNPQLPFSDLKLDFFGGSRGALVTPPTCGIYTTATELTPWSAPDSGPPATPSDPFTISSGPGGGPCPDLTDPARFTPGFSAGALTPIAGSFSPFVLKVTRPDGQQSLKRIAVTLPPGLLAKLAGVPRCAQADVTPGVGGSANCPAASRVGSINVGAGAGATPFFLRDQPVYLTDGYDGAPFGLAIDTHALAGPFDLGHVVVRTKLNINPSNAQVSADAEPLPGIIQGIPLHIRSVALNMDRDDFALNPTSCDAMTVAGQITGGGADFADPVDDTVKQVSDRFQVGACAALPFKPSFSASTSGKASKASGASLVVKLSQKPGEANIHKVDLTLPLVLPARLTTLQKACTEAQFNTNPAGCPAGSVIGSATARTPLLNVPLTGPAYLVSHGGAAFPDVEFILQGNERGGSVQIVLDGKTDIKKGITYSRFETVPDAPISSFETVLPQGPHSALAANGDLCASTKTVSVRKRVTVRVHGRTKRLTRTVKRTVPQPLTMPTTIVGQNGAKIAQSTKIAVTGCPKAKKAKAKARKARHSKRNPAVRR